MLVEKKIGSCLFHYLAFRSLDELLPLPLLLELDDFFFIICNLLSTGIAELLLLLLVLPLDPTRDPELEPIDFDGFLLSPEMLDLAGIDVCWAGLQAEQFQ